MGWGGGWKALCERTGGLWESSGGGYLGSSAAALCGGQSLIKTNENNCFHKLYFIGATHCLKQHLKDKSIKQ